MELVSKLVVDCSNIVDSSILLARGRSLEFLPCFFHVCFSFYDITIVAAAVYAFDVVSDSFSPSNITGVAFFLNKFDFKD